MTSTKQSGYNIPADLVATARLVIHQVVTNHGARGSPVQSALLASKLFEAIKATLDSTSRTDPATIGLLRAALDQCRRSVGDDAVLAPELLEAELRATLEILEEGWRGRIRADRGQRRFTVINGGRA